MKRDLLNYLLKNSFGMTVEEIKSYLKNPENYFDFVLNPDGLDERTSIQKFNQEELKIHDSGFSNPKERFKYENVPAAYNTVTISKMILLGPDEMNRLLDDLGSSERLVTPNIMLGFIRTLDGDNQWHENGNYKLVLASNCRVYRQVFMRQKGESKECPINATYPNQPVSPLQTTSPGSLVKGMIVQLQTLSTIEGPRWLDGRTANGTVGLAPRIEGVFTCTKWRIFTK